MFSTVLVVPEWTAEVVRYLDRNWIAIIGIVVIALASSLTTWALRYKGKWNLKYEEKQAKALTRWVILAVTSGFTLLGTLLYFVESNQPILVNLLSKILPHAAANLSQVLGVLYILYNFQLKKSYQKWEAKLAKWSGSPEVTTQSVQLTTPTLSASTEPTKPTFDS